MTVLIWILLVLAFLAAAAEVVQVACWYELSRRYEPHWPWNWRVLLGAKRYGPWAIAELMAAAVESGEWS